MLSVPIMLGGGVSGGCEVTAAANGKVKSGIHMSRTCRRCVYMTSVGGTLVVH